MKNNYLLLLVLLFLSACSTNRFISIKSPRVDFGNPLTQSTIDRYRDMSNIKAANVGAKCESLAHANLVGFELDILQLACAERWLSLDVAGHERALTMYNNAVEQFVRAAIKGVDMTPYNVEVVKTDAVDGDYAFDRLTIATDVIPTDSYMRAYTNKNVGVSVVGERRYRANGSDLHYPREGIFRPITVTATTQQSDTSTLPRIQLAFHLMTLPRTISFGDISHKLTYDLATPLLMLTEVAKIDGYELTGLFRSQDVEEKLGIYAIEQISTDKKPILMIHGLNSSPIIWRRLSWAIYSDPELSAHYQIWHAFYPSGPPPFYTAMRLRRQFNQLLNEIYVTNKKPETPFVWVIGHSMGGIISRTFVVDSENKLWDRTFNVNQELLNMPSRELTEIVDILKFSTQPTIEGVVFMDTPHNGSEQASGIIARLVSAIIELPISMGRLFSLFWKDDRNNFVTPEMKPYLSGSGPDSVRVLSPEHPLLIELSQLPPAVKTISIIGSNKLDDCSIFAQCPSLTDGVVPYLSSHLASAKRELIVQSEHNSYQSDAAISLILEELRASFKSK
jgi:hypothetical protein